jgi:hypothetical protein
MRALIEDAEDLGPLSTAAPLSARFAAPVAAAVASLLYEAECLPAGPAKTKAIHEAVQLQLRLLRADLEAAREARAQADWQRAERERNDRLLAPVRAAAQRETLMDTYCSGKRSTPLGDYYVCNLYDKSAWFAAGVEFGLPESEWLSPMLRAAAAAVTAKLSPPVQPSSTQSHPVQPRP